MSEQENPLLTDHIFVLKMQESRGRPGTRRAGRVEQLGSGEAARFASEAELWDFVDKVQTEPERRKDRS